MVQTIIGDCLQGMRVAIDHLAWALAESTVEESPRNTAFPIYLDSADFHALTNKGKPAPWSGLKKIEATPDEVQEAIEELQPYHAHDSELHPLWILNEYYRIERHRTISVIYVLSDYIDFDVGTLDGSDELVSLPEDMVTHLGLTSGAFCHGTELACFTLKEPVPDLQVKYDSPFYIAFGQRYTSIGDPLEVLGDIHEHIEQMVLPKFAKFFCCKADRKGCAPEPDRGASSQELEP